MPTVRRLRLFALVFVLAAALYAPSVSYGFVWDDISLIRENRFLHDFTTLRENLTGDFFRRSHDPASIGHWRPLPTLTYMFDWRAGHGEPHAFHVHNAILHGLAAALLAMLALELGLSAPATSGAALLFASHPVHVEAVAWISGRPDLLCGLFVIAALLLDARAAKSGGRALAIASGCATLAGLLSKEMAVIVPAAVALRALMLPGRAEEKDPSPARRAARAVLPHGVAIAVYLTARFGVLGILPRGSAAAAAGHAALFVTWWSAFLEYARVVAWPGRLGIIPRVGLETSVLALRPVLGIALFAATGAIAWRVRRVAPPASWGLACALLALAPVTGFLVAVRTAPGIAFPWAERFLFVPSIFLAIAAADLAARAARQSRALGKAVPVAAAAAIVALGARTLARESVWADQQTLFADAVAGAPEDSGAQASLGAALADAGDARDAEEHDLRALALEPANTLAHFNYGNLLRRRGDLEAAEAHYRAAIAGRPDFAQAWLNLGLVQFDRGRSDDAMASFQAADRALGGYPEAKVDIATLLRATGRAAESIPFYEEALRLDPTLSAARRGLESVREQLRSEPSSR